MIIELTWCAWDTHHGFLWLKHVAVGQHPASSGLMTAIGHYCLVLANCHPRPWVIVPAVLSSGMPRRYISTWLSASAVVRASMCSCYLNDSCTLSLLLWFADGCAGTTTVGGDVRAKRHCLRMRSARSLPLQLPAADAAGCSCCCCCCCCCCCWRMIKSTNLTS